MNWQGLNAADRVTLARTRLVTSQPFYGCLALHLAVAARPDKTATMATDGASLFYAPAFIESLSEAECIFLVAHEVSHCAYRHHARIGNRDLERFNRAADYCINPDLIAAGFTMPRGMLLDPAFRGMGAEEVYALLTAAETKPQEQPEEGDGEADASQGESGQGESEAGDGETADAGEGDASEPGDAGADSEAGEGDAEGGGDSAGAEGAGQPDGQSQGGGAEGQPEGAPAPGNDSRDAHGMGGVIAPEGGQVESEASADQWQVWTRQAVNVAKAQAGSVPGYLQELVTDLATPVADWRDLLANWIDSRVSFDYSFARPNRRFVHAGVYLPGAVVDGLSHVVFAVDTSGSITADMVNNAAAEIVGAMESGKFARLTVLMADTRVCSVAEFTVGDTVELTLAGGGGTAFRNTFEWIEANAPDASAVVYLTDLEVSDFGEEPACPVLWATHGDSRKFASLAAAVPFGDPVYIGRL